MFKQFKTLALAAAIIGGSLYAPPGGGTSQTDTSTMTTNANDAYGLAITTGSVVTMPTIMALNTQKALAVVEAAAAEAKAAMGSSDVHSADGGIKLAGSTGSHHRAASWLRVSYAAINNAAKGQEWNGNSYLVMLGGDYRFNKMFCAGLGLSYSRLDARTEFNNGTMIQDTFGINPYFVVIPHKNFNLELAGGANWGNNKDTRRWVTTKNNTVLDNEFKASPKSEGLFGGVFANFVNAVGKADFNLQVGYIMMQTKLKAFKETSANAAYNGLANSVPTNTYKAGSVTGKIKVGYQLTPSVAPFLTLHTLYDVQRNEGVKFTTGKKDEYKVDRTAFGGGLGLNFKGDDSFSGGAAFDYTKRGKLSFYVTALRLHYGF